MDVECDGGAGAGGAPGGKNLGLSGSTDGATSSLHGGTTSPACATSDGGNGNGGTGAPGGASAVTYLAAPALMEHLHVRQPEAVLTTTVVARKQAYNRTERRQIPFFLFLNKRYYFPISAYFNYQKFRQIF